MVRIKMRIIRWSNYAGSDRSEQTKLQAQFEFKIQGLKFSGIPAQEVHCAHVGLKISVAAVDYLGWDGAGEGGGALRWQPFPQTHLLLFKQSMTWAGGGRRRGPDFH